MHRKKGISQGEYFYQCFKSIGWKINKESKGYLGKCINPNCPSHKDNTLKFWFSKLGNGKCHKDKCVTKKSHKEITRFLQTKGVEIHRVDFDTDASPNQRNEILQAEPIDIINDDWGYCVEYRKYIEERGVNVEWFVEKYQPVLIHDEI